MSSVAHACGVEWGRAYDVVFSVGEGAMGVIVDRPPRKQAFAHFDERKGIIGVPKQIVGAYGEPIAFGDSQAIQFDDALMLVEWPTETCCIFLNEGGRFAFDVADHHNADTVQLIPTPCDQ